MSNTEYEQKKIIKPLSLITNRMVKINDVYKHYLHVTKSQLDCLNASVYLLNKNDRYEKVYSESDVKTATDYERDFYDFINTKPGIKQLNQFEKDNFRNCLFAPLTNSNRTFGFIVVTNYRSGKQFTETHRTLLNNIAEVTSLVALSVKSTDKLNFVLKAVRDIRKKNGKKEIFETLVKKLAGPNSKYNACIIHLHDESQDNLYGFVSSGIKYKKEGTSRVQIGKDVIGEVFSNGKTQCVKTNCSEFLYQNWAKQNGFVSMITVQLKDNQAKPYGTLSMFTKYLYIEQPADKKFIDDFIAEISFIIGNMLNIERLERVSSIDTVLTKIIPGNISTDTILKIFLTEILKRLNGEFGFISFFSKNSEEIKISCKVDLTGHFPEFDVPSSLEFKEGKSLSSFVIQNKIGFLYPSSSFIDSLYSSYNNIGNEKIQSELLVPLIYENSVMGLLVLSSRCAHAFTQSDLDYLTIHAKKVVQIIQNKNFLSASINLNGETFGFTNFNNQNIIINEDIATITATITTAILKTPLCCVWLISNKDDKEILELEGYDGCKIANASDLIITEAMGGISWRVINDARKKLETENSWAIQSENALRDIAFHTSNITDPHSGFLHKKFAEENSLKSMISIPIIYNRKVLGVINTYTKRVYDFFENEYVLLRSISIRCASALNNAQLNNRNIELMDRWSTTNAIAKPGLIALNFVHDITHKINALNSDITLFNDFLPNNFKKNELVMETLRSLSNHADSLRKSFETLISIGKQIKEKKKTSSLKKIIEDIEHLFNSKVVKANIELKTFIQGKEIFFDCYPNEIEQALVNMLLNSIHALEKSTHRKKIIHIKCAIEKRREKDHLKIEVYDNGCGIKASNKNKIYEMTFTTKGSEGSGFGLSICKGIVEHHEGEIEVESLENEWTSFYIFLPLSSSINRKQNDKI